MKRPSIWRYRAWTVIYTAWSRVAPQSYARHAAELARVPGDQDALPQGQKDEPGVER